MGARDVLGMFRSMGMGCSGLITIGPRRRVTCFVVLRRERLLLRDALRLRGLLLLMLLLLPRDARFLRDDDDFLFVGMG